MRDFADERDLIAHGVWMVDNEFKPIVVWHTKMLESENEVVGEYYPYERFDHWLTVGRQLLKTFAEFKKLLSEALDEEQTARAAIQPFL
jgi:hypothetical protein